jgi:sensor histidine kinase YesM
MKIFQYITPPFLFYNSLFWLFIIGVNFSTSFSDSLRSQYAFDWLRTTLVLALAYGPWLLFTPFLYGIINAAAAAERKHRLLKVYLLVLCIWLPCYIAFDSLVMLWNREIEGKTLLQGMIMYPKFYWFFNAVVYSGMFGAYLALVYYRDSQHKKLVALTLSNQNTQLELRLSEMKMQALQAQLDPHFLFNALNSISSLVRIAEKKHALSAIRQLSDLLRFAVGASPRKLVELNEELQFSQDYIDLQRLRFGERLSASIDNQCNELLIQCPPYIVQTLVENAIVHNLEKSGESLKVAVKACCVNHCLNIVVENSALDSENSHKGLGVGLENLQNRLTILYQDNFSLDVSQDDTTYRVNLSLPVAYI